MAGRTASCASPNITHNFSLSLVGLWETILSSQNHFKPIYLHPSKEKQKPALAFKKMFSNISKFIEANAQVPCYLQGLPITGWGSFLAPARWIPQCFDSESLPQHKGSILGLYFPGMKLKEKSSYIKSRLHVGAHELSPICGFPKDDEFTSPLGGLCGGSLTRVLFLKPLSKCQLFQGVMWLLRSPSWRLCVLFIFLQNFKSSFQMSNW